MGIIDSFKNAVEEKVNKEEAPQSPIVPQTQEAPIESEVVAPEEPKEAVVETPPSDRSAYNCQTCKGDGLVKDAFEEGGFKRCPECQGTGKVA